MQQLEQQLRSAQQQRQEAELQLHYATEEAQELRAAKESAVVEKEQVAVRSERRSQTHEVRCDKQMHLPHTSCTALGLGQLCVINWCLLWVVVVVEKEQLAVRSGRRSQAHEVRCDVWV